jgi:hypothetical protein
MMVCSVRRRPAAMAARPAGVRIVAISAGDAFDDAEMAQTGELSGEGCRRALGDPQQEVSAAEAGDVEAGTLQGGEQGPFVAAEKVEALDVAAFDGTGLGETVERPDASREVVQTGEVFEIAAVRASGPATGTSRSRMFHEILWRSRVRRQPAAGIYGDSAARQLPTASSYTTPGGHDLYRVLSQSHPEHVFRPLSPSVWRQYGYQSVANSGWFERTCGGCSGLQKS